MILALCYQSVRNMPKKTQEKTPSSDASTKKKSEVPAEPKESPVPPESHPHKVDLKKTSTSHRFRLRYVFLIGLIVIGIGMIGFGVYIYQFTTTQIVSKNEQVGFFGQIRRIIDEDVQPLQGEDEDRVNILLLGEGGLDHPGGTLTDTIMIASIKPSTKQVALLSIPRDLVVPVYSDDDPDYYEYRKINYAVEIGGIELALEKMEEMTGLEMHYYVLADFTGFRDIINSLGGLDIYVENSFTDYQYPDYNYGWQTIAFTEGWEHMDGERALQYARSRHGNNGEGSDFARANRQQKILEALRDEALSASTILNPSKITKILNNVGDHVRMNVEIWEMKRFADIAAEVNKDEIVNQVVDNAESGLVHSEISSETGAYVLIPNAGLGDFSEIQQLALHLFDMGEVLQEQAVIAVQNGSTISGLATKTANSLRSAGVTVSSSAIANANSKSVQDTIIYDLSDGSKPLAQDILEQEIQTAVRAATMPAADASIRLATDIDTTIVNTQALPDSVDFIVVVGSNQTKINTADAADQTGSASGNEL